MKIKVLHIIGSGTVGGAENFVYQLAKYQHEDDREIEPSIFFRKGNGYFFTKAVENELKIFFCEDRISIKKFFTIVKCFKEFDILHFHGLYPTLFFAAIMSRRGSIYYVHGARALTKNIKTILQNIVSPNSNHNLPTVNSLKRFIKRQWLKIFLKYFVKVIHAPSKFYVNFYIEKYGISKNKIRQLPLGINFKSLQTTKPADEIKKELAIRDEKIIGCVSTFRPLKRIDRLINSFTCYLKDSNELNTKLLIVGDGPEKNNLEEHIKNNNINDHVILTGLRDDVPDMLNIMDVFVLPSEFENFPISVVEAMSYKIPTIVFQDSGGAEELVKRSGVELIVEDEKGLAEKIKYLLGHTDEAKKLGEIEYQYVIRHLSIETCAKRMKEEYRRYV